MISELEKVEIQLLLEAIYQYYGFDFRNYALPFLHRRIWHRIHVEKLNTISGLQELVLHDALALERLMADISIPVTEMFRDPKFYKTFRTTILPLFRDYAQIRIWVAGCATGEEAYSLAIFLHEEGLYQKTTIYATDMYAKNVHRAKEGIITLDKMQSYTKNYLQAGGTGAFSEYYLAGNEKVTFHPFLNKNIVFAQHNLVTDASFNEFQIIFCRNVLIYFDKSLQNRVHRLLYESLSNSGILGLGNREGIKFTDYAKHYEELDATEKLYRKLR